jgi:hypothetical protein
MYRVAILENTLIGSAWVVRVCVWVYTYTLHAPPHPITFTGATFVSQRKHINVLKGPYTAEPIRTCMTVMQHGAVLPRATDALVSLMYVCVLCFDSIYHMPSAAAAQRDREVTVSG